MIAVATVSIDHARLFLSLVLSAPFLYSYYMQQTAAVPTFVIPHDTQDTFVRALGTSSLGNALFNSTEKKILALVCSSVFVLPLITSVIIVRATNKPLSLSTSASQHAMLEQPATLSPGSGDELAMAAYFMNKATNASSVEAANLLSQAKALLETTTQTGPNASALRGRLASLLGTPASSADTSPQRVAEPAQAPTAGALVSSTQSNATDNSVVMKAGSTSLIVSAPQITDSAQIYLTLPENSDNAVIYVKQKEAGSHFTLASLSPLVHDVTVTWYEIKNP